MMLIAAATTFCSRALARPPALSLYFLSDVYHEHKSLLAGNQSVFVLIKNVVTQLSNAIIEQSRKSSPMHIFPMCVAIVKC